MKRIYTVERLFSLGNYKNIKFNAGVEVDESDERTPEEEREAAFFGGE